MTWSEILQKAVNKVSISDVELIKSDSFPHTQNLKLYSPEINEITQTGAFILLDEIQRSETVKLPELPITSGQHRWNSNTV